MNDRLLLCGTNSGCGKTTVTCALLRALKARGLDVRSYKCGPDYIDPMFHREVVGVPARNLDPFFSDEKTLCAQLALSTGEISVLEGVMGYYDGVGIEGKFSTFDVARETKTPVVLVVDARGSFTSLGAVLKGFREFRPDSGIRGVIFNRASAMLYPQLCEIAKAAGVTPCGFFPKDESAEIGSRHLGLITASEIDDLNARLDRLGELAAKHLDLDALLALAASAPALPKAAPIPSAAPRVRIALARDNAFCFLYEENLEMLRSLGCELVEFSPLHDSGLPDGVGGLYLPGGYPELYLKELSENPIREKIRAAIANGLPTFAECGGFLYLHDTLDGVPMAGVIPAAAAKTQRLQRFGYVTLTAQRGGLLAKAGDTIRAHEFHYYDSTDNGDAFLAEKPLSARHWQCVHTTETLWAGFPHLYFPANPSFARSFVEKAVDYAR